MTEIVRAGPGRLDELEPLWLAMTEHHVALPHGLGPARGPEERWRRRRAYYEQALQDPAAFLLVAERDGRAIGYALVLPSRPSHLWAIDRAATLETLSVLPEARGGGVGSALLARVREELRATGVTHLGLSAVAANQAALRFYRREGFREAFVEMVGPI